MDYKELGFKAGIEAHQQLETHKLFCNCPSLVNDEHEGDIFFERKLKASAGEMGKVDQAAKFEMTKNKIIKYEGCSTSCCLVEMDEEPPHPVNMHALKTAMEVAMLFNAKILPQMHFMRKIVVDGSNVCGFQRTGLVAVDGYVKTSKGKVGIDTICLEEEAAKKLEDSNEYAKYRLDRLGVPLLEIATDASIKDPEHAKEVASLIGMILRSTGKVKRGIGTIRQDVNVSIKGHPRVEIKGFQELRYMSKVIENEVLRQKKEKGESHVRKANADGTTVYLRPMPGAERMYPETDIPVIFITKEMIEAVELPERLDEKALRLEKQYGLNGDLAKMVVDDDIDLGTFKFKNLDMKFVANVLVNYPKEIQTRFGLDASKLTDGQYREVLGFLDEGLISKEVIMDILVEILQGKKVSVEKYKPVDDLNLEKELKKIVLENPNVTLNALMGEAMKKFKGKVDGKKIMDVLKKLQ
jgi:Glu-tRNA(Gln) amidotransferase subunit E-like FAD-binding protein